ncbi:hypothetical protein AB0451_34815 [Streptomyces sp. NPDC052000]|uniref:hypothetical protein n=1 Tax=Streptomyces sp. NPDC052000 TaxID=3155676 RepID=UPI00344EB67F
MTGPSSGRDPRVLDLVRDVVAEVAPEELPLVVGLAGLDDATVVRRLDGRREALGFSEVAALVTPVVWLAVYQAAQRIVDGAASRATSVLRKLFGRPPGPVTVPPLTREQLNDVRESVLEMGRQRGLGAERAMTVADAVEARLALTRDSDPEAARSDSQTGSARSTDGEA